jgi:hypothetical protein
VRLDRATVCLPVKDRLVSHACYTPLGFVIVGEFGDDGLAGTFADPDGHM